MKKRRIVAMTPCRLGSQRIPKKNLRLVGQKTLSQWVLSTCVKSGLFDDVYLNSESTIFDKMASDCGAKFYQRPEHLSTNSATNDDFALDFMNNIDCDLLVQVNATSPFTTIEDLSGFMKMLDGGAFETLHTVKDAQIEALFEGRPLNFDPLKQMPPSQSLTPVKVFTSSIMAWDVKRFQANMAKYGCAVYGGDGKIGYYTLKGFSTLDIDNEFDFQMAELVVGTGAGKYEPKYYQG